MATVPCNDSHCRGAVSYDLATRYDGQRVACGNCGKAHVWSAADEEWFITPGPSAPPTAH